jgi:hypothetical protein
MTLVVPGRQRAGDTRLVVNADSARTPPGAPDSPSGRFIVAVVTSKNPLLSNTLRQFVRKRWKVGHNFAFLLDSQAKFP